MAAVKPTFSVLTATALLSLFFICGAHAQPSFGKNRQVDGLHRVDPRGRRFVDPDVTDSLGLTGPASDQVRGPIHDQRIGRVRPGNPSPSVR
ncbi:hypothetical protein [Methylobacterium sp. R2-1]|uniref:hypothetical protein n=1 Tax=Methylobacterium sp. R2-1 TaxID=2587064 RepID=UPI001615C9EE|nr:hypothetical protein [Methylobacterium sp. R2-1]MBB2963496.1 hypothetical protein [Methylobacterium sp. R2-1]